MKTLCYKIKFCWEGLVYNDGFVIIEIGDDGKLKSMEGLLTDDYLGCNIRKDKIEIEIYTKNSEGILTQFLYLEEDLEDFKLPPNIKIVDENDLKIKLRTVQKITSNIDMRKEIIRRFKENNVFEKGRS